MEKFTLELLFNLTWSAFVLKMTALFSVEQNIELANFCAEYSKSADAAYAASYAATAKTEDEVATAARFAVGCAAATDPIKAKKRIVAKIRSINDGLGSDGRAIFVFSK